MENFRYLLRPFSHRCRSISRIALLLMMAALSPAEAQWATRAGPWAQPSNFYGVDTAAFAVLESDTAPMRTLLAAGIRQGVPGLYTSTDEGQSWQPHPVGDTANPTIPWLGTMPTAQGTASQRGPLLATLSRGAEIAGNFHCDFLSSKDAGATWTVIAKDTGACVIAIDPSAPQFVYGIGVGYAAGFYAALYRSFDGGATWQSIGNPQFGPVHAIRVAADGTIYAVTDTIRVSHDHGNTWEVPVGWPAGNAFTGERVFPSDLMTVRHPVYGDRFALASTNDGVYQTTDGGVTWTPAGLQGFRLDSLGLAEEVFNGEPQVRIGYRFGLALFRGGSIVPMTNGLPAGIIPLPKGGRYVVSGAGLSICNDLESCLGGTLPHTATLVEYHNALLDHYFLTMAGPEADGIDHGAAGPGWSRTGASFTVFPDATALTSLFQPVCRFYGTPGIGPNSHFFTVDQQECNNVQRDRGWTLESPSAFFARPGNCGSGSGSEIVLYRLYNNRFAQNDSNHRYVADLALYQSMQAQGWKGEGAQLCVLR